MTDRVKALAQDGESSTAAPIVSVITTPNSIGHSDEAPSSAASRSGASSLSILACSPETASRTGGRGAGPIAQLLTMIVSVANAMSRPDPPPEVNSS